MRIAEVIVPLDQSFMAEAALPYAEAIARALSARLVLLTVIEAEPGGALGHTPEVLQYLEKIDAETAEGYLRQTVEAVRDRGLPAEAVIRRGKPVDVIVEAAGPDAMVVIATHGRGGFDRLVLGSVADKVMRLCEGPVLVAPGEEREGESRPHTLHRLLAPLDGSPLAETAIPMAASLAAGLGAEVVLSRVEPWLASMAPAYGYIPNLDKLDDDATRAAGGYLENLRSAFPAGVKVRTLVRRGSPAATLRQVVSEEQIDLVVMSTHGAGGFRRFLLGSTADRLIRAGVPVLLARPVGAAGT